MTSQLASLVFRQRVSSLFDINNHLLDVLDRFLLATTPLDCFVLVQELCHLGLKLFWAPLEEEDLDLFKNVHFVQFLYLGHQLLGIGNVLDRFWGFWLLLLL
jgi:hypothetical protein